MISVLGFFVSLIFIILSILHFHWAFGGKWGFEKALPTNTEGEKVLNPSNFESAIVGIGLLFFSIYYLLKIGIISADLPSWIVDYSGWVISAIFILRAIGDFKYIGFFKKIKSTDFGKLDTKFYSPLCLMLGVIGILLEII